MIKSFDNIWSILRGCARIPEKKSHVFGFLGIFFGFLSIFTLAIVFVPLGGLFSALALSRRNFTNLLLGAVGFILAGIGFITSPLLMSLLGLGLMA